MNLSRRRRVIIAAAIACGAIVPHGHGRPLCAASSSESGPIGLLSLASKEQEAATLERLETDRAIFRGRDGAAIEVPAASLVAWGRCPPLPLGPHVVLADGSMIAGRLTDLEGTRASLESEALGTIALPAAAIAGFRATAASRPTEAEIEEGRETGVDAQARWFILLRNGDRLSARSLHLHDGLLVFDWLGRPVEVPMERVQSLTTSAAAAPQPLVALRVALDDGSRLSLSSEAVAAAAIAADPTLVVAIEGRAAMSLAGIGPTAIAPEESTDSRRFAVGHTLGGDWPTVRGVTAFQGMAIGAIKVPTQIRYDLGRPAERLESTVAVDDSAGQGGRAIVRVVAVSADGTRRETFASPVLQGGDEPLFIRADLDGAKQFELIVEPLAGDPSNVATVWLDPRVIPLE